MTPAFWYSPTRFSKKLVFPCREIISILGTAVMPGPAVRIGAPRWLGRLGKVVSVEVCGESAEQKLHADVAPSTIASQNRKKLTGPRSCLKLYEICKLCAESC